MAKVKKTKTARKVASVKKAKTRAPVDDHAVFDEGHTADDNARSGSINKMTQKWNALYRKAKDVDAAPYSMKKTFAPKTPIVHKVLGWGYVLANRNDRLEVLFKDGIKYLISNYKAE